MPRRVRTGHPERAALAAKTVTVVSMSARRRPGIRVMLLAGVSRGSQGAVRTLPMRPAPTRERAPPGGDGAQASDLDGGRVELPAGESAGSGLAEPRDRETYADDMRGEAGGAGFDSVDTEDDQAALAFAPAGTSIGELAESLGRDERGDAGHEGGRDHSQHAGAADTDQAETAAPQRQDVAETAAGRAPEPGSTAPAEHQQGEGAAEHGGEGERAAGPGQEHPGDAGKARDFVVMVGEHPVHVVEADRTLDDDKPTGIGRKPTGDELRDMDSERTSAEDAFRKVL